MRFFICKDSAKFTKHDYEQYGDWYYYCDSEVTVWQGPDYIVLYAGYFIQGDMSEACQTWSFKGQNGNFFAVKLTPTHYEIVIDYFQQHKIFVAHKYGTEITNWLPLMTIQASDRTKLNLGEGRELTPDRSETFYNHVRTHTPDYYNYWHDAEQALYSDAWPDLTELADYIHDCMSQHSEVIKSLYKNRFISLSDGIDSVLQSQYFRSDPQYMYNVIPCRAGQEGVTWKNLTAKNFDDVTHTEYDTDKGIPDVFEYMHDSSSRTIDALPTMIQINKAQPDVVLYGVNGDEMFFKSLNAHLCLLLLTQGDVSQSDIESKRDHYGASYSLGQTLTSSDYISKWFNNKPDLMTAKSDLINEMTPKTYNRHIACNCDVIVTSLYNDRRIYHEVFKTPQSHLLGDVMDVPIQRQLLLKNNYTEFKTPHKDSVLASWEGMRYVIPEATLYRDIDQNL